MPATTSAHPMSSPRSSAFADFSHSHPHTSSRSDPVVVPARARDHPDSLHRDHYRDIDYKDQQHRGSIPVLDHGNMTSTSASTSSASQNLPGTPDREKQPLNMGQVYPHVRTNFRQGYHPPATKDNPVRQPPPIERLQLNNGAYKPRTSNTSDRSDDMPFDVKKDQAISPPSQRGGGGGGGQPRHPPTTWAVREELDPERGRFVITSPKYSDPTPLHTLHKPTASYGVRRDNNSVAIDMAAASTGRVEHYYMSPHRVLVAPNPEPSDYEEFGISPGSLSAGTGSKGETSIPEEEDSLFDFELEAQPPGLPKIGSNRPSSGQHRRRRAQEQQQHVVAEEQDDRDDDTASFEEAPYAHKRPSPTNLHERAAQAWAVRREKVSSLRHNKSKEDALPKIKTKSKEKPPTTSPPEEESLTKQGVSFGITDTVHHFQPDTDDDGTLGTYNSIDDRSLNSEYTKTIESEVEDVIKDILLIGTEFKSKPGRRKLKYRHEVKRKLRLRKTKVYEQDEASAGTDDKTNNTENDDVAAASKYRVNISKEQKAPPSSPDKSRNSKNKVVSNPGRSSQLKTANNGEPRNSLVKTPPPNSPDRGTPSDLNSKWEKRTEKQTSKAHREEKEEDSDPFLAMWGYVEGGMKAMSEALGLEPDPTEKKASSSSKNLSLSSSSKEKAAKRSDTLSKPSDTNLCTDQIALILSGDEERTNSPTKTTRKAAPMEEGNQGLGGLMDFAQGAIFGLPSVGTGDSGSFDMGGSKSQSQSLSIDDDDTVEDDIDDAVSASHFDERDPRLCDLALNAARSKHQIRGVEFDESIKIDLLSEVKVSVLELRLPLGLVFLENDGGCFVTQVSPDGSAARCGGVEIGDQLAAINGSSSIKMNVDGICTAISNAPDKKCVEMVFVRYQGPFRAATATSVGGGSFEFSADRSQRKDSRSTSSGHETIVSIKQPQKKEKDKKGLGRWFGRGKKK